MKLIVPVKIREALLKGDENAYAISKEALTADCGRMLGFARVTEEMRAVVIDVLVQALNTGLLVEDGLDKVQCKAGSGSSP